MRVLALDLSSKTGWSVLETDRPFAVDCDLRLVERGVIKLKKPLLSHGTYPTSYVEAASWMAKQIEDVASRFDLDVIVIEEIQLSKGSRYAQKWLGILHCKVMEASFGVPLVTVDPGSWRAALGLVLSKDDKKNNRKLNEAKKLAEATGTKLDKKKIGVTGRVNKKHLSVRWVNETFNLSLLMKDNDIADAIGLGAGYLRGAVVCDGT